MSKRLCILLLSCTLCVPVYASDTDLGFGEIQIGGPSVESRMRSGTQGSNYDTNQDTSDVGTGSLSMQSGDGSSITSSPQPSSQKSQGSDSSGSSGSGSASSVTFGEDAIIIQDDILDSSSSEGTGSVTIGSDTGSGSVGFGSMRSSGDDIVIEQLDESVRKSRNLVVYRDGNVDKVQSSLDKVWKIITKHADRDYYLKNGWSDLMRTEDKQKLTDVAKSITGSYKSDYDKIRAVYTYVVNNLYYDWDYADRPGDYPDVTHTAMEVYETNRAVCEGFASLSKVLLQSSGIPCMSIRGANHIYSAGYDADNSRWIVFDTTLGCKNYYEGSKWYTNSADMTFFDMSVSSLAKLKNHEVMYVDGLLANNNKDSGHYAFRSDNDNWTDTSSWYCSLEDGDGRERISVVDSIGGVPVLKIDDFAFDGNDKLVSVDMSGSRVTEIGNGAFRSCEHLSDVTMPESLVSIGDYAFFKDYDLLAMDLSKTKVKSIGSYAFSYCTNMVRASFPESLSVMGESAFYCCKSMRSVGFDGTKVSEIPADCFRGCTTLGAFTGSKSLNRICPKAFASCPRLRYVRFLNSNISINESGIGRYVHYWFD